MDAETYAGAVEAHYRRTWPRLVDRLVPRSGAHARAPDDAPGVFVFDVREGTTGYATCGMSKPGWDNALELHLLARRGRRFDRELVDVLAITAHFHQTGHRLALGHTVNFGTSWLPGSSCTYGLVSLPYLDGPALEVSEALDVRFLWLIPITKAERDFKVRNGLEALEERFEAAAFDYLDPLRASVS